MMFTMLNLLILRKNYIVKCRPTGNPWISANLMLGLDLGWQNQMNLNVTVFAVRSTLLLHQDKKASARSEGLAAGSVQAMTARPDG